MKAGLVTDVIFFELKPFSLDSNNNRMSRIVKHNGTAYLCGQVAKEKNGDTHTQVTVLR
jgi:enamine deaminase RidA (YjgF/YER057c/UK114 family)